MAKFFIHRPSSQLFSRWSSCAGDVAADVAGGAISPNHAAHRAGGDDLRRRQCEGGGESVATPIEQEVNGATGMIYVLRAPTTGDMCWPARSRWAPILIWPRSIFRTG